MHACETNFSVYVADIRPHESKRVLLAAKRGQHGCKNSPGSPNGCMMQHCKSYAQCAPWKKLTSKNIYVRFSGNLIYYGPHRVISRFLF